MQGEKEDISTIFEKVEILERKFKLLERVTNFEKVGFKELLSVRGFKSFNFKEPQDLSGPNFFREISKYYVRRLLSDLSLYKALSEEAVLFLFSKWKVERQFLEQLVESGLIKRDGKVYFISYDFDLLIESFIADFIKERFGIESILNVKVKELDKGGDIDILGKWKLELIMIELKESPPNNISLNDLKLAFERFKNVKPDLFIFLIDTTLSIKRNILDNLVAIYGLEPIRLREGVHKVFGNAFVVTAKREMLSNLGFVIERELF